MTSARTWACVALAVVAVRAEAQEPTTPSSRLIRPAGVPADSLHALPVALATVADAPVAGAPTAHAAPTDSAVVAKPAKPAAPAAAPAVMTISLGTVKFSGYLQAWYVGRSTDATSTFRVRTAQLKFVGAVNPRAHWTLMLDPAKALTVTDGKVNQASQMLQDAYGTVTVKGVDIDAGQFKLPFAAETDLSPTQMETIERTLFITKGKLGFVRDVGAMVSTPAKAPVRVKAGLFNSTGESQNTTDGNNQKVVAGRLELHTPLPGFRLGSSGAWGGRVSTTNPRHDRLGADASYGRGPVTLRGEWMRGWDGTRVGVGYYGLASYHLRAAELVSRYDVWTRDVTAAPGTVGLGERDLIAGVNYTLTGSGVKLGANYAFREVDRASHRHALLLSMLTAW